MVDVASANLVQALKGNDAETLLAAIDLGAVFQDKPGDDRQRLRGDSEEHSLIQSGKPSIIPPH